MYVYYLVFKLLDRDFNIKTNMQGFIETSNIQSCVAKCGESQNYITERSRYPFFLRIDHDLY